MGYCNPRRCGGGCLDVVFAGINLLQSWLLFTSSVRCNSRRRRRAVGWCAGTRPVEGPSRSERGSSTRLQRGETHRPRDAPRCGPAHPPRTMQVARTDRSGPNRIERIRWLDLTVSDETTDVDAVRRGTGPAMGGGYAREVRAADPVADVLLRRPVRRSRGSGRASDNSREIEIEVAGGTPTSRRQWDAPSSSLGGARIAGARARMPDIRAPNGMVRRGHSNALFSIRLPLLPPTRLISEAVAR